MVSQIGMVAATMSSSRKIRNGRGGEHSRSGLEKWLTRPGVDLRAKTSVIFRDAVWCDGQSRTREFKSPFNHQITRVTLSKSLSVTCLPHV